jgi:hypothetical protein
MSENGRLAVAQNANLNVCYRSWPAKSGLSQNHPGTGECIWIETDRKGGAVINLPNRLKETHVNLVRDAVISALQTILRNIAAEQAN